MQAAVKSKLERYIMQVLLKGHYTVDDEYGYGPEDDVGNDAW